MDFYKALRSGLIANGPLSLAIDNCSMSLEELTVVITAQISVTTPGHVARARILEANKKTSWGARDYLYLYSLTDRAKELDPETKLTNYELLCCSVGGQYSNDIDEVLTCSLLVAFSYSYISIADSDGKYCWWEYDQNKWQPVNEDIVNEMFSCFLKRIYVIFAKSSSITHNEYKKEVNRLMTKGFPSIRRAFQVTINWRKEDYRYLFATPEAVYEREYNIVRVGLPSDLNTKSAQVTFSPAEHSAKRNKMMKILRQWFQSQDIVNTVLDLLAYTLYVGPNKKSLCFIGKSNTAKSTFNKILGYVLGGYCYSVDSIAIRTSQVGPNPLMMELTFDTRLILAPDTTYNISDILRSELFKLISGGDKMSQRGLYDKSYTRASVSATTIFSTNNEDTAIRDLPGLARMLIVEWKTRYVTREDLEILPHLVQDYQPANAGYAQLFVKKFGPCLQWELLLRGTYMLRTGEQPVICKAIVDTTTSYLASPAVRTYFTTCLEIRPDSEEVEPGLEEVYTDFCNWVRSGSNMVLYKDYPKSYNSFCKELELLCRIRQRDSTRILGTRELFAEKTYIKIFDSSLQISSFGQVGVDHVPSYDPNLVSGSYNPLGISFYTLKGSLSHNT